MADLFKIIGDVASGKDIDTDDLNVHVNFFNQSIRSISSAAANTTYYFPMLVSKNVDPESVYLISDYLDTMYAYFVRATAQQTKAIRIPNSKDEINVKDFLKRFHQNAGISGNVLRPTISFESAFVNDFEAAMLQNESANEFSPYELLSNKPLNEASVSRGGILRALKKNRTEIEDDLANNTYTSPERNAKQAAINQYNTVLNGFNADRTIARADLQDFEDVLDKAQYDREEMNIKRRELRQKNHALDMADDEDLKRFNHANHGYSVEDERYKEALSREEERMAQADAQRVAKWNAKEVEKRNMNAQPLVVPLEITFLSGEHHQIPVTVGVGVKTLIHDIAPAEIRQCVKDGMLNGKLKSFIQWTSGEVKSIGDLLFGIKDMKRAIGGTSAMRKWNDIVMRRKLANKLTFGLSDQKPFLPNVTFVLSMTDANAIKAETGVDLIKDVKYVYRIMKESMLLCFIIADEVNEKAYVMFDGHSSFDAIPYKSIERDTRKETKQFEQLLKIMAMR